MRIPLFRGEIFNLLRRPNVREFFISCVSADVSWGSVADVTDTHIRCPFRSQKQTQSHGRSFFRFVQIRDLSTCRNVRVQTLD
jgi:hypothetical protein